MHLKGPDFRHKTLWIFAFGFVWCGRPRSSLHRIYLRHPSGVAMSLLG